MTGRQTAAAEVAEQVCDTEIWVCLCVVSELGRELALHCGVGMAPISHLEPLLFGLTDRMVLNAQGMRVGNMFGTSIRKQRLQR